MTQIFKSYDDFLDRTDKRVNGVSEAFAAKHPDWETTNTGCSGCFNCVRCSNCMWCLSCEDCKGMTNAAGCANNAPVHTLVQEEKRMSSHITVRTDALPVVYCGDILLKLAAYAVEGEKLKLSAIKDTGVYQPFALVLQDKKFLPCEKSEVLWALMGRKHKEVPAVFILHGVLHIEGCALAMLWAKSLPADYEHSGAVLHLASKWGEMVKAVEYIQLDDRLYESYTVVDSQPAEARFVDMLNRFKELPEDAKATVLDRLLQVWKDLHEDTRDRLLNNSPMGWSIQKAARPLLIRALESFELSTLLRDCSTEAGGYWDRVVKVLLRL